MSIFTVFRKKKPIPAPWEKYYKEEERNIKIPNVSLYDQVLQSYQKYPNYKAIVYMGKVITYRKLVKLIDKAAASFYALKVKKGDIVTICMPNMPEALICFYALNKLGAIANMLHPLSAEEEIKESLISTNSKYLVMVDMFYDKIENTIGETPVKKVIFVSPANSLNIFLRIGYKIKEHGKYKKYPHTKNFISMKKFYRLGKKVEVPEKKFGKNTPAVILHSGGTSGTPKNVVIQNRSFILEARQEQIQMKRLHAGDCCLAIMPNFHGFGLSVLMHTPLSLGCYTILVPQFDAKKFDKLIEAQLCDTCNASVIDGTNNMKILDDYLIKSVEIYKADNGKKIYIWDVNKNKEGKASGIKIVADKEIENER